MDGTASFSYKKLLKTITIFFLCLSIFALSIFTVKPDGVKTYAASTGMAVVEVTTKRTLFESNANQRMPMASTTKAMTALVVLENSELDEMVTVPRQAVGVEGSSIYLKEGEKLTVKELLYGLMLRSGNDAAVALALHVGGSLDGFANMMNEKAKQLGLKNTHFTNPHGLHDDNHYTTAYDLAICSAYAMQNKDFAEIVGAKSYTINSPQGKRYLVNKNKILTTYEGGTGVKIGFTKKAGRCLIASSEREGLKVVAVVLNCGPMFQECSRLMDKAHNEYKMVKVFEKGERLSKLLVDGGREKFVDAVINEDIMLPMKKDGSDKFSFKLILPDKLDAPIKKDMKVGEIEISLNDCLHFSQSIYTIKDINKKGVRDYLKEFFD
ncbi:MAG: D-alanyl-D-alanine carboxypeptidase family protein [Bacillota bacterium]|mgnify:CR=1 FL=1|jgi:D-alanyl-D-alanine carboxypeptidase (penicillin-binding protein 5/6)|nr:D-alanyl-D-alanine carboxypeptidase family protein [Bacillota bacterium]HHU42877.1 D-alanyl-D-alanine carboxypeptidase [Clostridiales bacterium]